jgi:hypothetical protein
MYFFEQTVYKKEPINTQEQPIQQDSNQQVQQDPNQQVQQDPQLQVDPRQQVIPVESSADILNSPTSISIKRYFLIKKLFVLNEKLNRLNMKNDVLNFLIDFIDSFSYEALLSITRKLVEEIYNKLQHPEQVKPKMKLEPKQG